VQGDAMAGSLADGGGVVALYGGKNGPVTKTGPSGMP
jgi:hypothetical protein